MCHFGAPGICTIPGFLSLTELRPIRVPFGDYEALLRLRSTGSCPKGSKVPLQHMQRPQSRDRVAPLKAQDVGLFIRQCAAWFFADWPTVLLNEVFVFLRDQA